MKILIISILTAYISSMSILNLSVKNKPHPEKVARGGEDAYYASENLLIVADGVGGWAR